MPGLSVRLTLLCPANSEELVTDGKLTVLGTTAAFRHTPSDILRRHLDRARLALYISDYPSCLPASLPPCRSPSTLPPSRAHTSSSSPPPPWRFTLHTASRFGYDRVGTHVNTVLTINHKLLARGISFPFTLHILVLVHRRGTRIPEQATVLDHVFLGVPFLGAGLARELQVRGLALGVVCACARYRGENVEREDVVGFGVLYGGDFAVM